MSKIRIAAQHHLSSLEARIASQSALVRRLESAGTDTTEASHCLEIMQHALASMRIALHELAAPNALWPDDEATGQRRRAPRRSQLHVSRRRASGIA